MNGDGVIDTVDTTIIARHLAGFTGASLTAGLALGGGTRPDFSAVTSFLVSGCAVGGAINAFVQGGNSFGAPGVLDTNDAQSLTVKSGGTAVSVLAGRGDGLRIVERVFIASNGSSNFLSNVINGNRLSSVGDGVDGATIAGGGFETLGAGSLPNVVN